METIQATLSLPAEALARLISLYGTDRHAAMVAKHGEACTKAQAARIISCGTSTINAMLRDGRIRSACEGTRVDVRSLADYIERREGARQARPCKRRGGRYV